MTKSSKMRRIAAAIGCAAVLAMGLLVAGCGSASPSEVVTAELDAAKSVDRDDLVAALMGEEVDNEIVAEFVSDMDLAEVLGTDEVTQEQAEQMADFLVKLCDFDYELGEETIDGDTAEVEVTFTAYDFKTMYTDAIDVAIDELLATDGIYDMSDDELTAASAQAFLKALSDGANALTDKSVSNTATLTLTKKDGQWVLDELTADATDAMTGGLMTGIDEM